MNTNSTPGGGIPTPTPPPPPPSSDPGKPPSVPVKSRTLIFGSIAVVMALVGGLFVYSGLDDAASGTGEVFLEPVQSTGIDPFFSQTAELVDIEPVLLPAPDSSPAVDDTQGPTVVQATDGSAFGLYGGTLDNSRCNRLQLVEFLEANSDKAAAWAGVQGIPVSQIRELVDSFTPVVLLNDTRVSNYGFRNGQATQIQSVLQAGTAVLVDEGGLPRARCACGNPLSKPVPQSSTVHVGAAWNGFTPSQVQVVAAGQPSEEFLLQDLDGGEPLVRPTGSDGEADFEAPAGAAASISDDLLVPELGDPSRTVPVGGEVTPGTAGLDSQPPTSPTATTAGAASTVTPTIAPPATTIPTTTIPTTTMLATTIPTTTIPTTTIPPTTTSAPPVVPLIAQGSVDVNSTFSGFPAANAVDGNPGTSWFSVGPSVGPAVFTWSGSSNFIAEVSFVGNEANSTPDFRSGFGFANVTIEVLDGGVVVFSSTASGYGASVSPNVAGDQVRLTFTGHDSADCGGFADLFVSGYAVP